MSLPFAILRTMTSHEQRAHWHQKATWLSQLGLSPGETTPIDVVEEVAQATLVLLEEVRRLEDERDEARRIGTWLYNRSPGIRLYLGDASEWPWLTANGE